MSVQTHEKNVRKLPTPEEIDAMAFPHTNANFSECDVLCLDLRQTFDDLTIAEAKERHLEAIHATAKEIQQALNEVRVLIARLKAINGQMRALHCKICLPE